MPQVATTSDVDCKYLRTRLQQGKGPVYALGPFGVVGPDVYGLDADDDDTACERSRDL